MTTIWSTILVLGILIFVHELGHFLVAKLVGIRVEKFSLGFPPKLVSFRKGETEYCISVVPLGGYVKMAGESPDESEITGAPYEFMSKTPLQRSAVILAGPLMNFFTAIVILSAIFFVKGYPTFHKEKMIIDDVSKGSPGEAAGLAAGDEILSVDGQQVDNIAELMKIVSPKIGERISIEYRRGIPIDSVRWAGRTRTVSLVTAIDTTRDEYGEDKVVGIIGLHDYLWWQRLGPLESIERAVSRTWEISVLLVGFLWKLVTLQVSAKSIGGVIFIAQTSGEAARLGLVPLFSLIALLSVNLAVVNILPIPVLDGGHLVFLAIEVIRRKPLTVKQRAVIQQVGLAFLLMLIVMVTYNDITRIFRS